MKVKIKAVGFDFDGTLIVSDELKCKIFEAIFREKFGVLRGVAIAYKQNGQRAMNREERIKYLFEKFVKRKPSAREVRVVSKEFGSRYEESLKMCPLFSCTNIVSELKKQVRFTFLLSLENKKEVVTILKHCGLAKYFDEILGGPKSKVENLKHVLKKHHLKPDEVMYIGNSDNDIMASREVKVKAVLIQKKFNYAQLRNSLEADFVFSSLCEVPIGILKSRKLINLIK